MTTLSPTSALQRLFRRHLPRLIARVSPEIEVALRRSYWRVRHRPIIWKVTSYHRYRRSVLVVDGVRLQVDRSLSRRMVENIWSGAHVRPERSLVHEALSRDDVVLELGGGVGLLAISCAQRIGGDRVFSFEANRLLEPLVRRNCELNAAHPRFEFCVLGQSEGTTTLHVGRDFWVSSLIRTRHHDRTMSVAVRPFAREVARIRPTFLVVDIEGAEEELFRHAPLERLEKIMIELHPRELGVDRTEVVKRTIRDAGFAERRQIRGRWYLYERVAPPG